MAKSCSICVVAFVIIVGLFSSVLSSNILVLYPMSAKSHMSVVDTLLEELVERGHRVTLVSMQAPIHNITGLRTYTLSEMNKKVFQAMPSGLQQTQGLRMLMMFSEYMAVAARSMFTDTNFKKFLHECKHEVYDLVLVSALATEYVLPVAHLFEAPVVYLSVNVLPPYHADVFHVPSYYTELVAGHPWKTRFMIVFAASLWTIQRKYWIIPNADAIVSEFIPNAVPIDEIERNISLIIVNSQPALEGVSTAVPNVIEAGAMHCHPAKKLPKEFEDIVSGSGEDGFIVFSLGTIVKGSDFPQEMMDSFTRAFSSLKQRVIWKSDDKTKNVTDLSPNVFVSKWLPQQDLLGHPKCRLAILHGGLLSLQEAAYHGVPVLGVPIGYERILNMQRVFKQGFTDSLDWQTVSEEIIKEKIMTLINDKRFKQKAMEVSTRMRDHPQSPVDKAAFWIEYVIRHNGAPHFKSLSRDQCFILYYFLDVFALFFSVIAVTLVGLFYLSKVVFKLVFTSKKVKLQ